MQLADAEKLAVDLMREFGLINTNPLKMHWRFEFDDAVRRFGCCHRAYNDPKITLSRILVLKNDQAKVEDTIRHEIAHALCEPRQGHGLAWKKMCAKTGAKPERCYNSDEVETVEGDWSAKCGGCGRMHYKFRRPKRDLFCAHKECRRQNPAEYGQGRFNPLCKLVWRHKNALPEPKLPRTVIEAMKAHLRAKEQPESRAASDSKPTMPTAPELTYQCAKCDRKSISFHVTCPVCEGDMVPESKLRAEKEELKRKIVELQKKLRTQ